MLVRCACVGAMGSMKIPKNFKGGKVPNMDAAQMSKMLPPHMLQSWNLLGLEADRFDPIENAPED